MRLRTIKKRMRLSMLPADAVDVLYILMYGINDKSTEVGQKNNLLWSASVGVILMHNAERRRRHYER